jgi:MoaA/NifB/PqqE/SkfB family radical SAM enzyme
MPGLPTRVWAELGWFGLTTVARHRTDPIIGSIILTDRCNLNCQHCAVGNIRRVDYPWQRICADMHLLRGQGVRVLFLYGGEPFLWHDGRRGLSDVVAEARALGFASVNVVTNGTRGLDLPEADVILVSVDGTRAHHDRIRGPTYDRVLESIERAPAANLCLYMAVNRINVDDIEHGAGLACDLPHVRAVSYNLHTPYPGTEHLGLTPETGQAFRIGRERRGQDLQRDVAPQSRVARPVDLAHAAFAKLLQDSIRANGRLDHR